MNFSKKKWGKYKKWTNISYIYFSKLETLPIPQVNVPFTPKILKCKV